MVGLQYKIPGVIFTKTGLTKIQKDEMVNAIPGGCIFIADFGREQTLGSGIVPTQDTLIKNLADEVAPTIMGAGTPTTVSAIFENSGIGQPDKIKVERTSKGGVLVLASQTAMDATSRHAGFRMPDVIKTFLHGNPTHAFYFSIWGRLVRAALPTAGTNALFSLAAADTPTANYMALLQNNPAYNPTSGGNFVGANNVPNSNALGAFYRNLCVDGWTGTRPGTIANVECKVHFGQRDAYVAFMSGGGASGVIYRVVIIDVTKANDAATAAGLPPVTYATVDAWDKAAYDLAFQPGGRFDNDTFSAASTLP